MCTKRGTSNETVPLDFKNISSDAFRLATPGPNSPALKLLDVDAKLLSAVNKDKDVHSALICNAKLKAEASSVCYLKEKATNETA